MILDVIILLVAGLGFYRGFQRGIIKTLITSLSMLVGSIFALRLAPSLIGQVEQLVNVSPTVSYLIGIVLAFIIVMSLFSFAGKQIERLFEAINLDFVNKIAGGIIQALFYSFLLSLGLTALDDLNILNNDIRYTSQAYYYIETLPRMGRYAFENIKPIFFEFWDLTVETFNRIKDDTLIQETFDNYQSNEEYQTTRRSRR